MRTQQAAISIRLRLFFTGYENIAELLIQNGTNPNVVGEIGNGALHTASYSGKRIFSHTHTISFL